MQSVQTGHTFPLSSVKPFDQLLKYREYCLSITQRAFAEGTKSRKISPISNSPLQHWGDVGGFEYGICPGSGSLFIEQLPSPQIWAGLLKDINSYRHSPKAFHANIENERTHNVLEPKLRWVRDMVRVGGLKQPAMLELATAPSDLSQPLKSLDIFSNVTFADEMAFTHEENRSHESVDVITAFESLDRIDDPVTFLKRIYKKLNKRGMLFVTSLVSSGFDLATLGADNVYLYPPDRANCFTLQGLTRILSNVGFELMEVSTPGVLDVAIVKAHMEALPNIKLSSFERTIVSSDEEIRSAFQGFLQKYNLSSFARVVALKSS